MPDWHSPGLHFGCWQRRRSRSNENKSHQRAAAGPKLWLNFQERPGAPALDFQCGRPANSQQRPSVHF
jgi:hypothetical protein